MNTYKQLKQLVADKAVRVIHIEAVPRSISTAVGRALNEAQGASVFVNEPFNHMAHDVDIASAHVLDAVMRLRAHDQPITVITKSMSRNLSHDNSRQWMALCDGVVWSVRDPRIQMASLVTRLANDLTHGSGTDVIQQSDLTSEHIQMVSDFLGHGPISANFAKTSWADMHAHFSSDFVPKRSVAIDASELVANPHDVLAHACNALGLRYSAHMATGWRRGVVHANTNYSDALTPSQHAWTRVAMTSKQVLPAPRQPIQSEQLTPAMQDFLQSTAMPAYSAILSGKQGMDVPVLQPTVLRAAMLQFA